MPPGDPLPPPASGLFLEVSFRRLLLAVEAVVAGEDGGGDAPTPASSSAAHPLAARPDLRGGAWRGSPVFHHVRQERGGHRGSCVVGAPDRGLGQGVGGWGGRTH